MKASLVSVSRTMVCSAGMISVRGSILGKRSCKMSRCASLVLALLVLTMVGGRSVHGLSCSSPLGYLSARDSAQSLLSPGYPSDYENNQNCRWLISSQDTAKKVQVEVVRVDLANWAGGECEDFLELRDGKDEGSPLIKRWCGSEAMQFKTKGPHLLVKFVTDNHLTAPGFALKFYHIDDYESECDPYSVRSISLGSNPLFLDLPMYMKRIDREVSCDYHIKSEFNSDVTIDLEVMTFSKILCDDGSFLVYDGQTDNAPLLIDWCYSNQPFRRISSSGNNLFLRFRLISAETDWYILRVKVSTQRKAVSCPETSIPTMEVSSTPSIFVFPVHHQPQSTRACPLRLWAEREQQSIRVEVISPDPHCGDRGLRFYDGYDLSAQLIGSLCDKDLFSSSSHTMVFQPINDEVTRSVAFKVSAVNNTCNGQVEERLAIHDEIAALPELANPQTDYAHDLNCSYLLRSDRDSDAVEVTLQGRLVGRHTYSCDGDRVTLYDGPSTRSPVLSMWCGAVSQSQKVVSSGPTMLLVLTTDSYDAFEGVKVSYYAVPQKGSCKMMTELSANSTMQDLTSPNYPLYYPINSYCEYKLTAPEGHVVQFDVIHSRLENDCSDTVRVYNGPEKKYEHYLGRWCGDEKPQYRSKGRQLLVVFSGDSNFNSGGFKAHFYATVEAEGSYLIPAIVGSLLVAIVITIIIVVLYVFIKRRKRQ